MIGEQISDDDLRRLLETAAETQPVPDDGIARVLEARNQLERPSRRPRMSWPAVRKWAPATLIAVGILTGGAVAVGVHSNSAPTTSQGTSGFGSNGTSSGTSSAPNGRAGSAAQAAQAPAAVPSAAGVPPTASVPSPATRPGGAQPRIVQTGSIALSVDDARSGAVVDQLSGLARGLGGYVADSSSQAGGSSDDASVTLRVPVATFGSAVSQVSGLGRVTRSTTDAQDVTGEYVDLGARIKALQETRATYVRILAQAGSIGDTLAVQQQITSVQTQIEQLQGQQQVLGDRSDLATLSVTIAEPSAPRTTDRSDGGFSGAWHRAGRGFADGLQWLIAASGPVLLVALIGAVLFWPVRRLVRLVRRQMI